MSQNLEYVYAIIDTSTGVCLGTYTSSGEITGENFVPIPQLDDNYVGKYYNPADGLFYYEPEYITVFEPA